MESINCKHNLNCYLCKDSDDCEYSIGIIGKRKVYGVIIAYNCIIDLNVQAVPIPNAFELILERIKLDPEDFNRFVEYEISEDPKRDEFIEFLKSIGVNFIFRNRIGIEWYFREKYPDSIKYVIGYNINCDDTCEEMYYSLDCHGCSYSAFMKKCTDCYNCEYCVDCIGCIDCSGIKGGRGLTGIHSPIDQLKSV